MLAALMAVAGILLAPAHDVRRVLVLYPVSDGQPGILRFDESLRSALKAGADQPVQIYNEYIDAARFPDERHQKRLAEFLRGKYSAKTPDVVISALAPSLDFVLKHREELFPEVPVVYGAIDRREVETRELGPGVGGIPMTVDLEATLDLALRLHPGTRRVFVVAGESKTDSYWVGRAREAFRGRSPGLAFDYLTGLPLDELLDRISRLPDRSIVYYLHIFKDGRGETFVPAEAVHALSSVANAPIYGHFDTYVGRGIVGGRVVSFGAEGENAAKVAARILTGQSLKEAAAGGTAENPYMLDWHELRRWGIEEARLPRGCIILNKPPSYWHVYKRQIVGTGVLCTAEAILIAALLLERASRRRAERISGESRRELLTLHGRLLQAQEEERRRIARELHDDLNQSLALIAVELDLLAQVAAGPGIPVDGPIREVSSRVKELSSAVHDLSHQLHPAKLEQLGFVAAVRGLCGELGRAHGLDIDFNFVGVPPSIGGDTSLCLYRIVQEALSNVVKHSGARHARVELRASPDAVLLGISDDGSGFDPAAAARKGGLGLVGMRERLRPVGGELTVDSRPSGGTRISVRIPLAAPRVGREVDSSLPLSSELS